MTIHPEYSQEERELLLKLAHDAIESALEHRSISADAPTPHLAELRGCVGYVFPILPVYAAVIETARAAASQDTRFRPVSRDEASQLQVSLSVLSPLRPIDPDQVEIGRHGLLVSLGVHRGLLLPQVPLEHHWDRQTFLEQTCRKAGLSTNAWKTGATLEAFTAEVFQDAGVSV